MTFKHLVLLIALVMLTSPAFADDHIDCSQIENARERLACFDAKYPRDPEKPFILSEPLRPRTATTPSAPAPRPALPAEQTTDSNSTASSTPKNEDAPIRGQKKSIVGGLFDNEPDIDFTTTIAAIRAEDQKKMVFRLDNGQIWIQSTPRALNFSEGDTVTIKSARMGGFIMRNEGGTSTRVTRIQ